MNRYIALVLVLFLSGCVSYKVVPKEKFKKYSGTEKISIKRENERPEGGHCFEPMLYVLSLGIIPTHCVNTYSVSADSGELGTITVTFMQGWVTLLMAPFPVWQYGYGTEADVENSVKNLIEIAE